jgi:ribosomal protein S4E
MARGPKKHLKRLHTPKHWMLSKMDGIFAPRPSQGPHKLRECLPLMLILRNRLKYALTGKETKMICMQKAVKVDGKVRTDPTYPAGFMDVIEIPKSLDQFRLIFDTKRRFVLHRIKDEEKKFKLCRVKRQEITKKKVPVIVTHDGRTIRYPDPLIKVDDVVKLDIESGKVIGHLPFEIGMMCMVTKGRNTGRVGTIAHIERHPGAFDIINVKDNADVSFSTRSENVFVIGRNNAPEVSLPKGQGIKLSILSERDMINKKKRASA